MLFAPVQSLRQVHGDLLVGIGGRGVIEAHIRPAVGGNAGLLLQLALGGMQAVFLPAVQFSGRDLGNHLIDRVAVLALDDNLPVIRHRHHADGAHMTDQLAEALLSVRQTYLVPLDIQNHPVEQIFARDLCFSHFLFFHDILPRRNLLFSRIYSVFSVIIRRIGKSVGTVLTSGRRWASKAIRIFSASGRSCGRYRS